MSEDINIGNFAEALNEKVDRDLENVSAAAPVIKNTSAE